jgi:hypothetical protein
LVTTSEKSPTASDLPTPENEQPPTTRPETLELLQHPPR